MYLHNILITNFQISSSIIVKCQKFWFGYKSNDAVSVQAACFNCKMQWILRSCLPTVFHFLSLGYMSKPDLEGGRSTNLRDWVWGHQQKPQCYSETLYIVSKKPCSLTLLAETFPQLYSTHSYSTQKRLFQYIKRICDSGEVFPYVFNKQLILPDSGFPSGPRKRIFLQHLHWRKHTEHDNQTPDEVNSCHSLRSQEIT